MGDIESLLNDSIATESYHIGPISRPEALINLSEIDFEALQEKFAAGRKHTEAEKLRCLIEGKLAEMLRLNPSRTDFAEKFEKIIDDYNAGSKNIEELFVDLKGMAVALTQKEKRHIVERLSEEELAISPTVSDVRATPTTRLIVEFPYLRGGRYVGATRRSRRQRSRGTRQALGAQRLAEQQSGIRGYGRPSRTY